MEPELPELSAARISLYGILAMLSHVGETANNHSDEHPDEYSEDHADDPADEQPAGPQLVGEAELNGTSCVKIQCQEWMETILAQMSEDQLQYLASYTRNHGGTGSAFYCSRYVSARDMIVFI